MSIQRQAYQEQFVSTEAADEARKWLNNLTASLTTSQPGRVTAGQPNISLQNLGARVRNAADVNLLDASINGWSGITLTAPENGIAIE